MHDDTVILRRFFGALGRLSVDRRLVASGRALQSGDLDVSQHLHSWIERRGDQLYVRQIHGEGAYVFPEGPVLPLQTRRCDGRVVRFGGGPDGTCTDLFFELVMKETMPSTIPDSNER